MKDVTERLEGEAPTRRVFQQQLFMTLAVSTVLCSVQAAPQGPEALGSKLTPLGGEIAASASGDIPAWTQPGQQDEGWSYGQVRGEHWKFKGDKPLYSIDANNLAQHSSKLSPGQVELFKRIPGYRMDVYPTRRTCSAPDFVVENTRQNVGFAKLDAAGLALDEAHVPGIPFPMPSTGAEVMWNMKMRYRGVGVEIPRTISGISPRKGGEWLRQSTDTFFFTPWGKKGSALFSSVGRLENATFFNYLEPAALAGQSAVQTAVAGEQATTFYYYPGQRRVRRAPQVSYDGPGTAADGLRTSDNFDMYNGAPDRYDWKLEGKKEIYIPYNSYKLDDPKIKYSEIVKAGHINQDLTRYELHRVWHVVATLKPGERHIYAKRDFYIDEDTWQAAEIDHYDGRGTLWRVAEAHAEQYYDKQVPWYAVETLYDLLSGRYLALGMKNEEKQAYDFNYSASESDYTPAALRQEGVR